MKTTFSMFQYWTDGSTPRYANPDAPKPSEAKPFVVQIRSEGWVPITTLVFARDAAHAETRVRDALDECCKKHYRSSEHRALRIRDGLVSGELHVTVESFDIRLMPSIQWAMNGGL